jgi:hypothetical protein
LGPALVDEARDEEGDAQAARMVALRRSRRVYS